MSGGITQRGPLAPQLNPESAGSLQVPPGPGSLLPPGGLPVPLGPNGKPLPGNAALPTALGTTTGRTGKTTTATPSFSTDSVERTDDGPTFDGTLGTPPTLPESESLLGGNQGQSDFKAFAGQITAVKDLILQPGAIGQISARAQAYIANPGQSVLGQIFAQPGNANVTGEISANIQTTANDVAQTLPPSLQPIFNQIMTAAKNSPIGQNPTTLAAFAEASADYLICMAAALNTTDGQKNKDFLGNILSASQAQETAKQGQINAVMTGSAEKTQAQKDEQAAAERNKFWNIVLAVVMIVVAVVLAVVAVITCFTGVGEALIGAVAAAVLAASAAIAAVVMAVITIIQQLPTILEACGVNCDGFRALLAGPFGKFLQVLTYVCMACEILYAGVGIASAIGGTAQVAVQAGAQAGAKAAQAAIQQGLEEGMTMADATASAVGPTADAIAQAAPGLSSTVTNSMAQATANAVGQSLGQSVANGVVDSATGLSPAMTAGVTAAKAASTAASTAVQVLNGTAEALGVAGKVVSGVNQMTEAQINFQIAELGADVEQLQAQLKLVQTELQNQQDQSKDIQDSLKEVMTISQNIMQKLFGAMNSQSDIVQTVGAFGKKG